jgi:hypothetical protein
MEKAYPGSLRHWEIYGVDIVLAADGTAYARFVGWSQKIEIGGAKVIAPLEDTESAQQAPFNGIPLFMFEGDECYSTIKASLARMFREGHLKDTVEVTLPHGSQRTFKV